MRIRDGVEHDFCCGSGTWGKGICNIAWSPSSLQGIGQPGTRGLASRELGATIRGLLRTPASGIIRTFTEACSPRAPW